MPYIDDATALAIALLVIAIIAIVAYSRTGKGGSNISASRSANAPRRQHTGPPATPPAMPPVMPPATPPVTPPAMPPRSHPHSAAHGARSGEREHFGGGGPDGTAYAGWFDASHRDAQVYMQRGTVRGDGDPDCVDSDSVRVFDDRVFATAAIDPIIEREAGRYAQQFRTSMIGADLPPCNCAPQSCACPWGVSTARRLLMGEDAVYPEVPGEPLIPEVGSEVGPLEVADCGVPYDYAIPSDPICWDGQGEGDFYGPEGPSVYPQEMYSLTEPDHELLH